MWRLKNKSASSINHFNNRLLTKPHVQTHYTTRHHTPHHAPKHSILVTDRKGHVRFTNQERGPSRQNSVTVFTVSLDSTKNSRGRFEGKHREVEAVNEQVLLLRRAVSFRTRTSEVCSFPCRKPIPHHLVCDPDLMCVAYKRSPLHHVHPFFTIAMEMQKWTKTLSIVL